MTDLQTIIVATEGLAAIAVLAAAGLAAWRGWLSLRRQELDLGASARSGPPAGARIELADMKERIRKLEAIAAGVEL